MRIKQLKASSIRQLRHAAVLFSLALVLSPTLAVGVSVASSVSGASRVYAATTTVPAPTKDCNGHDLPAGSDPRKPVLCEGDIDKYIQDAKGDANCAKGVCIIRDYLNPAINTMAALVGIAVTISIIYAGIRYSTSADSPQKVSEAKQRIVNSILVLIGFFLFYSFLNWVIPGGVTNIGP